MHRAASAVPLAVRGIGRPPRGVSIALVIAGAIVVLLVALAWFGPIAHPRTVQVAGATGADAARITGALREAGSSESTFAVSQENLMAAVEQYPDVASVKITSRPPFRLDLAVVMRPPVAKVNVAGRVVTVAGDGTVLRRSNGANVPRVDASVKGVKLRNGVVQAPEGALSILGAAPASLLELAKTLRAGESGVELEMSRGPRLIFGDGDHAAEKWAAVSAVLAEGAALRATYIDVRVPGRPAVGGLEPSSTSTPVGVDAPPTLGAPTPTTPSGGASAPVAPVTPQAQTPSPQSGAAPPANETPAPVTPQAGAAAATADAPAAAATGGASTTGGVTP